MADFLTEDITALCSRAGIDSSRYKDFTSQRTIDVPVTPAVTDPGNDHSDTGFDNQDRSAPEPEPATEKASLAVSERISQPGVRRLRAQVRAMPAKRATNPRNEVTTNLLEVHSPANYGPESENFQHSTAENSPVQRDRWSAIRQALSLDPLSKHEGEAAHALPAGSISILGGSGGVGKTTIAASLARVLTGVGESVLLAGLSPDSILPFYFGARSMPGSGLRSFLLPDAIGRGSLHLYLDAPTQNDDHEGKDVLNRLCTQANVTQGDLDRSILVFPAGAAEPLLPVLRNTSISLVIIVPDLVSAIGVGKLLRYFREQEGQRRLPYFLINKFDSARPLHQEMRNHLHEQLGARLLPLVIRRSDDIQDALVARMTVIDYSPEDGVVQDLEDLADWVVGHTSRGNSGR